jgi:hypothetical protein
MRHVVALILVLVLGLAVPALASAQDNPFQPLPQGAQPTPAPTPTPSNTGDQQDVSRAMLLGIAGGVLVIFVGIGVFITRDARRSLTEEDRRALDHVRTDQERRRGEVVKRRARAKGKAQRRARKAQRRR